MILRLVMVDVDLDYKDIVSNEDLEVLIQTTKETLKNQFTTKDTSLNFINSEHRGSLIVQLSHPTQQYNPFMQWVYSSDKFCICACNSCYNKHMRERVAEG